MSCLKVMEGHTKLFRVSYKRLLLTLTEKLGWSVPIYNSIEGLGNMAMVIVRPKDKGPMAYYFEGKQSETIAESEEGAAEEATYFLVKKTKTRVLDFNLKKKEEIEAILAYYSNKRERLAKPLKKRKFLEPEDFTRSISIDYVWILENVLAEYSVLTTNVECVRLEDSEFVCLFGIQNSPVRSEWLMGPTGSSQSIAHQNLARRALRFLQPLLVFEIVDLSYPAMRRAEIECALQRESYVTLKERLGACAQSSGAMPLLLDAAYTTPQSPDAQIQIPNSPPPAPKKPRPSQASGNEFSEVGTSQCLYNIPDDLSTIFSVIGQF